MKIYKLIKKLRYIFFIFILGSCAKISTIQPPSSENNLVNYKRAYIDNLPNDEWLIKQALLYELTDMGIEVIAIPFEHPNSNDLIVKYSFDSGWDITKYLKAFQLQFIDALSGKIVSSTSYQSEGIWKGKRDSRLEAAFNDLRKKNGYPPTKQFQ